jgi:glucose/arabinose dehydrogenase
LILAIALALILTLAPLTFAQQPPPWKQGQSSEMANSPLSPIAQPPHHQGDILDAEFGKGRSCSEFAPPLIKTGPHVAGNGVMFYAGSMFPAEYKNRAFLARRGSWNRTQKTGFRVMMVTLRPNDVPKYEPFAEGWLDGGQVWGRPVYTTQMKDGPLLISDDYAGAIYRVSYSR